MDYTACVALQIRDASGSVVTPPPVCDRSWNDLLDAMNAPAAAGRAAAPMTPLPPTPGAGEDPMPSSSDDAGAPTSADETEHSPARFSTACQTALPGTETGGWMLLLGAALACVGVRRARRSRS
jgi:hypothetical protein